jgi:glycosyltransferase involved in cell wall biosynthesis
MNRIAILHYAGPPTVGGVESTIAYHARGLADLGYPVRVISGSGSPFDERVESRVDRLFGSTDPAVLRMKAELDAGNVTAAFESLVRQITEALRSALADCSVCIAHNVPTLHKNLALTTALASLAQERQFRLIAWCHDLAWTNAQYRAELHDGHPWNLLRQPWPGVRYVTVSDTRQAELAALLGIPASSTAVLVPGIDPARFFHWTPTTEDLAKRLRLLDADGLLLLPARLTRRKNIALALRILAEVRCQSRRDFRLIVTGPPGPHNPANPGYLGELLALRRDLGLEDAAHFVYTCGISGEPLIPDDDTTANLYQLSDALLFPSTQEGFGIPVLEAGIASLPAFCADIPALYATGRDDAYYFDPVNGDPADIAALILSVLDASSTYRLRVRVRQQYRWEALIRLRLLPLLEGN